MPYSGAASEGAGVSRHHTDASEDRAAALEYGGLK